VKNGSQQTFLSRNARFVWLAVLCVLPAIAFGAYEVTPHEEIWHDVLYSLICVPIFFVWVFALFGCVLSFLFHRCLARA
jgi:hypothetical protein